MCPYALFFLDLNASNLEGDLLDFTICIISLLTLSLKRQRAGQKAAYMASLREHYDADLACRLIILQHLLEAERADHGEQVALIACVEKGEHLGVGYMGTGCWWLIALLLFCSRRLKLTLPRHIVVSKVLAKEP